jgi:GH18 family chitinase
MNSPSRVLPRFVSLFIIATVALVPLSGAQEALPNHLSKRVVGDYGFWSKSQTPPYGASQIPYHKLTHINHAGVSFDASGTLSVPDGFIEPILNHRAHAAGVKVLLLLGGDFSGLEASGNVQTLVDNIAAWEQQYGYDGVDVDWEFPANFQDRNFLVTLRRSCGNRIHIMCCRSMHRPGAGPDMTLSICNSRSTT